MLDRHQLEAFAAVAETRSFEVAAQLLHVTRGAVSQRIKLLEQSLTAVLLLRGKPVQLTPAGEILLRHVNALRMLEGATLRDLAPASKADAPTPVAVAVNPDSLATWFPTVLWPLLLQRNLALEVIVDDEDHTDARLARGEVIGCVSREPNAASGFVSDLLGTMAYRCYATPDFERMYFPQGVTPAAVVVAPAIVFDRKDTLHAEYLQRRFGFAIPAFPRHYLPAPVTLMDAIVNGIGYGLLPERQAAHWVEAGRLVELAPAELLEVRLYWHRWAVEPELSRDVTRRVLTAARTQLGGLDGD